MFAVYRYEISSPCPPRVENEFTARYEGLLVGQRQAPSRREGRESRSKASVSHQRVDYDPVLHPGGSDGELILPVSPIPGPARFEILRTFTGQNHIIWIHITGERIEPFGPASRGEGNQPVTIRVAGENPESRPAD